MNMKLNKYFVFDWYRTPKHSGMFFYHSAFVGGVVSGIRARVLCW